jgi:hypothetical protein
MKIGVLAVILLTLWVGAEGELYEVAEPDDVRARLILGRWAISNGEAVFEYTDDYVCRVEGFKFYRYTTSRQPKSKTFIYTVLKSRKKKKKQRYYFCRGLWKEGRAYGFTTSIYYFLTDDRFVVMSKHDSHEVYFTATRLKE